MKPDPTLNGAAKPAPSNPPVGVQTGQSGAFSKPLEKWGSMEIADFQRQFSDFAGASNA